MEIDKKFFLKIIVSPDEAKQLLIDGNGKYDLEEDVIKFFNK